MAADQQAAGDTAPPAQDEKFDAATWADLKILAFPRELARLEQTDLDAFLSDASVQPKLSLRLRSTLRGHWMARALPSPSFRWPAASATSVSSRRQDDAS